MALTNLNQTLSVMFKRRQFLIILSFVMTISKSQGQSLSTVGVCLSRLVFTHGQLYIVVSRVKSKKGLKNLCLDCNENPSKYTTNVVYKEVF
ncbi:hypothetical protein ACS0TY_007157 [Phlomoides rotata]